MSTADRKLAANEGIKDRSNYLRGTIAEGLADLSTGGISADDQQLLKFHGSYPVSYTHLTLPTKRIV